VKESDTVSMLITKRFRLSTIRSLHRRGLMSANSDDPRLLDGHYERECLAWLGEGDHPARPLVWTSSLGGELLGEKGLLPKNLVENVSSSSITEAELHRHLKGAGIVDLEVYRGNRNVSVSRIISSRPTRHPCKHRYEGRDIVVATKN
jgi:hypothetical protein